MHKERLRHLLEQVRAGKLDIEEALAGLRFFPYEDTGFAKIDHHRHLRTGFPEVIFCQGKTVSQVTEIARRLLDRTGTVVATRAGEDVFRALKSLSAEVRYHRQARVAVLGPNLTGPTRGRILVISAGTADLPVAEEAAVVAEALGNPVGRLYDVGVAGLHRLLDHHRALQEAAAIIAVAGMEGALPGVVAGLTGTPVIGVPTSIGYGASFGGLAALLTMLNSCAGGVAVVNIDNGFGAAVIASRINQFAPPAGVPARQGETGGGGEAP